MSRRPEAPGSLPGFLHFAVLATLSAAIGFAGYHFYTAQKQVIELELREQLREVADLKVNQVAAWRLERVGDATVAVADSRLMPLVRQLLQSHDTAETRQQVTAWMDAMRTNYQYANIVLTDASGAIHLSSGPLLGSPELYASLTREALASEAVVFRDVHRDEHAARPHFVLGARLKAESGAPFGAVLLSVDPAVALYPMILRWPTSSRTAEAVLGRRDRDDVLYLSDLRRNPGTAMELRTPLAKANSPVARAARGEEGLADGVDGSGVAVLASARKVPDSDWFVVAKIDADEAYAPLAATKKLILLIGGLLVLLCVAGVGLIWRHQASTSYRQQYEAEQERRALLGHYDYLTRYANDAILLLDHKGGILEVNERALDNFGYSKEELLRMNVRDLKDPVQLDVFEQTWGALLRQGSLMFETTHRRKEGAEFASEVSARLIDVEGSRYCQCIIRDITERKQAEKQIRRLNRLYAVLSQCGQAMVHAQTETGLLDQVCWIASAMGGFRLAFAGGMDAAAARQIMPLARAGEGVAYLDEATFASAEQCLRERRAVVCHDLSAEPAAARQGLLSSISLPLRRGGEDFGVLALYSGEAGFFNEEETALAREIAENVSYALDTLAQDRQRRRAEEDLRLNRERLELVLDASDEGYWDWDLRDGEVHQSPRYDSMLGYRPGDLKPGLAMWREMLHPEDRASAEENLTAILESGADSFSREYRMRTKRGNYIWILSRGKIVARDERGKPVRVVGTNTDITERKKLEEQFLQAQKLESVGRLAGGVAHDFNNLLTVINGYSSLLLGRLSPQDPHRRQLEEIRAAGAQAAGLTQQLLAFSRKQKIQPRRMAVNAAVSDSRKVLGSMVGENIELTALLRAAPDEVMADPGQFLQVLMNLVVNARDAMPGGGRLVIETANVEAIPRDVLQDADVDADAVPGPCVMLQVTDTGTGMDQETRQHIFEPFFTTKKTGEGTGLGLATVYGIVCQSGGCIRVDSEPGKGAAFKVYLPRAGAEAAVAPPSEPRARRLRGSETILVVEDQDNVRGLTLETLRSYGYAVTSAANANEALLVVEQFPAQIHLLLTDVVMPGMNGKILAERVKALKPEIRVLFMSGYNHEAIGLAGEVAAGACYLQKPFTPEILAAKVREALNGPPRRRRILVVDDEPGIRNLMRELLAAEGHSVVLAGDGQEALRLLSRDAAVSLVITDLVMPGKEGFETLQELRRAYPHLKTIAMSGAFGGQFLKMAEKLGVSATLPKPIRRESLLEALSKAFEEESAWVPADPPARE